MRRRQRHSDRVTRTQRWQTLRLQALRRDGFKCVECGKAGRLAVDHIQRVKTHPELAYEIENLQSLCWSCHSRKTHGEMGFPQIGGARRQWNDLVRELRNSPHDKENTDA